MIPARFRRDDGERGQGLVELALVVPIIIALFVSTAELGLIYGKVNSLGYASREGARTGSALAHGGVDNCDSGLDPAEVDRSVVSAVQRILTSPDSGIDLARVQQIRIFRATSTGAEWGPIFVNRWEWADGQGPLVDSWADDDGNTFETRLDFRAMSTPWPACQRKNGDNRSPIDSIGVTIEYKYDYATPLPLLLDALSGGGLTLTLSETTVMALNPLKLTS